MIRLYLIVEGPTELQFADQMLALHLAEKNVMLRTMLSKTGTKGEKKYKGGAVNYDKIKNDITDLLKQEKGADVRLSTMFDLYGLPGNFPGYETAKKHSDPYRIVECREKLFSESIQDSRFMPYLQLHEFEALLFTDIDAFVKYGTRYEKAVDQLKKTCIFPDSPERIDDGETSAPSKRIAAVIPEYDGAKVTMGPAIAKIIGLDAIRKKCPHFNQWLEQLEQLDKSS
jgi:hypothetical protein